jgi:hypothetical protein
MKRITRPSVILEKSTHGTLAISEYKPRGLRRKTSDHLFKSPL